MQAIGSPGAIEKLVWASQHLHPCQSVVHIREVGFTSPGSLITLIRVWTINIVN
jgi:hypothetical protein